MIPSYSWCARIQHPERKPVLFGTVFTDQQSVEEARALLIVSLDERLPGGYTYLATIPGAIFFGPQ